MHYANHIKPLAIVRMPWAVISRTLALWMEATWLLNQALAALPPASSICWWCRSPPLSPFQQLTGACSRLLAPSTEAAGSQTGVCDTPLLQKGGCFACYLLSEPPQEKNEPNTSGNHLQFRQGLCLGDVDAVRSRIRSKKVEGEVSKP